jgi:hypothetical protein
MEDSSEHLPKPPRRTAARPFFSPRPSSGEGVAGPLELSRRRSAQLFTPPGSSAASEHSHPEHAKAASNPSATSMADDDHLVVEMFEPEEIELTAAASAVPHEHSIEVIAYDDANSLLQAAARDGKHPRVDGLQLETTEFSFEQEAPPPRMSVDSFWGNEPFAATDAPPSAADAAAQADETEATIDQATAGEPACGVEASAPPLADIAPPWRNRLTPSLGLELVPEEPEESAPVESVLAESAPVESAPAESVPAFEAMLVEPARAEIPSDDAAGPPAHEVADALVRIAARVRDGELEVPAGAGWSDEAALSAVLTALLRTRH